MSEQPGESKDKDREVRSPADSASSSSSDAASAVPIRARRFSALSTPSAGSRRHADEKPRLDIHVDRYGPRAGIPSVPTHFPRFEEPADQDLPPGWRAEYNNEITRISLPLRFKPHYEPFGLRWRCSAYDQKIPREMCFVVFSQVEEAELWPSVCRNIYICLREKGIEIPVEIIDWDKSCNALNYPLISAHSPLVALWPELRARVLTILETERWHTLTIYGNRHERAVPVFVLRVWEPRKVAWDIDEPSSVVARITELFGSYMLPHKIVIGQAYEIHVMDWPGSGGSERVQPVAFEKLLPGAGLELTNSPSTGTGTFAGHFLLQGVGKDDIRVGLTCYHIVRHPVLEAANVDQSGLPLGTAISHQVELQSPTLKDRIASRKLWARQWEVWTENRIEAEQRHLFDPSDEQYGQKIGAAQRKEDLFEEGLRKMDGANPVAGTLLSAGGYRVDEDGWSLDWALFRTHEARLAPNKIPTGDPEPEEAELKLTKMRTDSTMIGSHVYKIGNKTGFTRGEVSQFKSEINMEGTGKVYSAWVAKSFDDNPFARRGDSGALVWDTKEAWCGLIFGGPSHEAVSYFIPAEAIVRDVKTLTGGNLVLPAS